MKKAIATIITAFVLYAFVPLAVHVQGIKNADDILRRQTLPQTGIEAGQTLPQVIGQIINVALSLVGLIFFCLMVYAGYLWLTARGDSEPVDKAKEIIRTSIIGLVIVMSAYAITVLVTSYFDSGSQDQTQVCNNEVSTMADCRGKVPGTNCGIVPETVCMPQGQGRCTCETP